MKVNNEISDKTSQELNETILAAKIILDLLIFLAITTALPLIIVYLALCTPNTSKTISLPC